MTRQQFEVSCVTIGHLLVGSPEDVTEKILTLHHIFGMDRFLIQMGLGSLPHANMMRAIKLLAKEVAPMVRTATGGTQHDMEHA